MIYNFKCLRKQVMGLALTEAEFSVRGFNKSVDPRTQSRLELVAKTVVTGYNLAVEEGFGKTIQVYDQMVSNELNGFFNEGIGMGLYALDLFSLFNKDRFWRYVKGDGEKHEYMAYIGAGLASGVFGLSFEKFFEKASPMSGCLILDGIGFYHAYFHPTKTIKRMKVSKSVSKNPFYLERFDNGVGRALWFYHGGDVDSIYSTILKFERKRQSAIWSGVGLAATYAGGVSEEKILKLKRLSGENWIMVAQGSMLASHARHRAGNPHDDQTTSLILVGKTSLECHHQAVEVIKYLDGRRFIDNQHSFQVFLKELRTWVLSYQSTPALVEV